MIESPRMQILAEMIIYNESRVGGSRVQAAYSKPRALSFTLALRYEVPSVVCCQPVLVI